MLNKDKLINDFFQMVGWPYRSPGTNDQNGIDCSGAFVRGYRLQNASIYHGSNRIIRVFCNTQAQINGWKDIKAAAAVFKARSDLSKMSGIYKPGGEYYNAALPYDYYHIGLITGLDPLTVTHATSPKAKKDTLCTRKSGEDDSSYQQRAIQALQKAGWTWVGLLNAATYDDSDLPEPEPPIPGYTAIVYAANGKPVKMRAEPSTLCRLWWLVPIGTNVELTGSNPNGWTGIRYNGRTGYMQSQFLNIENG
jgi:Bacterial SH3 domain.